jgi:RNA polymerase sigma-B factor
VKAESEMRRLAREGVARAGGAPAARDRLLFRRYHDRTDPVDRDELVRRFMPLARQVAARYAGGVEPYEDLLQVASLALVRAIDRFDPSRGVAFSSFVVPTMRGEIKRHYRDKTWAVRVPRGLQDLAMAVRAERGRLSRELGRSPTARELCERMAIDECELLDAIHAGDAWSATSLEVPRVGDDSETALRDTLAYHERGYELADARVSLERLLRTLCRRDREVVRLRFEEDLTQREIGERMDLSQMHVSRILQTIVAQLGETAEQSVTQPAIARRAPDTVPS